MGGGLRHGTCLDLRWSGDGRRSNTTTRTPRADDMEKPLQKRGFRRWVSSLASRPEDDQRLEALDAREDTHLVKRPFPLSLRTTERLNQNEA